MFTGIVEAIGVVHQVQPIPGGLRMAYTCPFAEALEVDDSVSVNGVCQTVVARDSHTFSAIVVEETLRKTAFSGMRIGDMVNFERSLRLGDRLDGHLVQGHVDTVGRIESIETAGADRLVTISFPEAWAAHVVGRGSIAVDGVSLTVARLERTRFTVALIPYSWEHTTFHTRLEADWVNLEFDLLGKYLLRKLEVGG